MKNFEILYFLIIASVGTLMIQNINNFFFGLIDDDYGKKTALNIVLFFSLIFLGALYNHQ